MRYHSTRDNKIKYKGSQAILEGLAPDGGLFVPDSIPDFSGRLGELQNLPYPKLCFEVVTAVFEEFRGDEKFASDIENAFNKFFLPTVLEISKAGNYFVELSHGPTCAFKDFALSVLPFEIAAAKRAAGQTRSVAILTATSGDTGKAALEAFAGVDGFKIAVVYPKGGVSKIQELQMNCTDGDNTLVCGLNGNFDDCQKLVKEMVAVKRNDLIVTSANSINIARLVPQISYYFYAYFMLVNSGEIPLGEKIDICVPTGNFGNILSGFLAKKMGLPIDNLICASNRNNVLTDFFSSGVYDARRKFYLTKSPSMDILVSSNFERFLWFVTKDAAFVKSCMKQLNESGYFDAKDVLPLLDGFKAGWADESQTANEIKRNFQQYNYLIDTHTAVASAVASMHKSSNKMLVMSTANPYKFASSVLDALGGSVNGIGDEFDALEALQHFTTAPVPPPLSSLKSCTVKHNNTGNAGEIKKKAESFFSK